MINIPDNEKSTILPNGFVKRMKQMLGSEYAEFEKSYSRPRLTSLRINSLKAINGEHNMDKLREDLEKYCSLSPVDWADNGFYVIDRKDGFRPGSHPLHEAGAYYIQEASAMVSVSLAHPTESERILDLCAAPGGKSTQLAASLNGSGLLVANEINASRASVLSSNIERMGITNAVVTNETPQRLAERFPCFFDKIIVDAPCSGEGMFRKEDAALTQWSEDYIRLCAKRQREILDNAAKMLRPSGKLIYSTCTFAPEENEGTIAKFIEHHPEFTIIPPDISSEFFSHGKLLWAQDLSQTEYACAGLEHTVRLFPHIANAEGHFAAVLMKSKTVPSHTLDHIKASVNQSKKCKATARSSSYDPSKRGYDKFLAFAQESLNSSANIVGIPYMFGENLYLLPFELDLDGMRVLRPGLHLGTIKGDRFEPAHALALALGANDVKHTYNLTVNQAISYIRGETIDAQIFQKGWYLLLIDGLSLGWGKVSDGIIKNHYPKGLRRNLSCLSE